MNMPFQEILGSPEAQSHTDITLMDHGLKIPAEVRRCHTQSESIKSFVTVYRINLLSSE